MIKGIQFSVYIVSGIIFGSLIFQSMAMSIYGAPTSVNQFIALIGAMGLIGAAFVGLLTGSGGRVLAIFSLVALGVLYIPASRLLAPSAGYFFRLDGYIVIGGYLAVLAFSLFYPKRHKFSVRALVFVLFLSSAIAVHAYYERLSSGQYDWASLVFFQLKKGSDELLVESDPQQWMTDEILAELKKAKITGQLKWNGAVGQRDSGKTMILIGADRITEGRTFNYSKEDTIIYYFDASELRTIPPNAHTFEQYPLTLETNGRVYYSTSRGGTSSAKAFYWKQNNEITSGSSNTE